MVQLDDIKIGLGNQLTLIAGPCVVENEETTFNTADTIREITERLGIPFIFKSSYKKANRTSLDSFTGIGDEKALGILAKVKEELNLHILTDVHSSEEVRKACGIADVLQIPAFLCRQTELLIAAGETGKVVNIKKGQFLSPQDMKFAAEKVESTGNKKIMFTERGTTFGYGNLVVDMRALVVMRELGYPVVMDATHSVQMPGAGGFTSGDARFISHLAKAAVAVGIDALFLEVHPDPPNAKSDAKSQLPLDELEDLLVKIKKIDEAAKG